LRKRRHRGPDARASRDSGRSTGGSVGAARTQSAQPGTELYKHREPGYYPNIEELRAPGDIEFRESPSHAHTHAPLQRETSHTTSRPQKPKRLGDRTLGIGMHGALVTPVASLVTYCSDRPATCTSARAVATVECTSSEQSPVRDARAPFVTGNRDGMLKPRSRSPWSSPMRVAHSRVRA
jgi:hypothetical protein